jgi:copper oxidase (laccase) domain-containing protein
LVYIYTNNNLLQEWLGVNPIAYNEKNMLSENFMSYGRKKHIKGRPLSVIWGQNQHEPFKFPNDP